MHTSATTSAQFPTSPVTAEREDSAYAEAIVASIRDIAATALLKTADRKTYTYKTMPAKAASTVAGTGAGYIQVSAQTLIDQGLGNDPVFLAKREIFWLLSDLTLDIVGKISRRNSEIPSNVQELVKARLSETLEQKIFENPTDDVAGVDGRGLDLEMLVRDTVKSIGANGVPEMRRRTSPIGWARQTLTGSVAGITRRIIEANPATTDIDVDVEESDYNFRLIQTAVSIPGAEDHYLESLGTNVLAQWEDDSANKRGAGLDQVAADALLAQYQLPALCAPTNRGELLELASIVAARPELAWASLRVCAGDADLDALTGINDVDDALLALWDDYAPDHRASLLTALAPHRVVSLLVKSALTLPDRPSRDTKTRARTLVRGATTARGWTSLSIRAMDAYVVHAFSATSSQDTTTVVAEPAPEAEMEWETLAQSILDHDARPAGSARTIAEVGNLFAAALVKAGAELKEEAQAKTYADTLAGSLR